MSDVSAFILIGGKSSRLGRDKAFVSFGENTLLERATNVVQEALPDAPVTAVAGSSTQFAIQALASGLPFIFDLHEDRGPLGGLHAALSYAKTPWIFLLACDYPFVSAELIQLLAGRLVDNCGAVVPIQPDGRTQPLCAFYRVEAAMPVVTALLELPRVPPPMYKVVEDLKPMIVKFEEYSHLPNADAIFTNINTPEDLSRLEGNS